MSNAICIKCGAFKCGAFESCGSCGLRPETDGDFALSLVLTDRFNHRPALEKIGAQIGGGITRFDLLYSLPPELRNTVLRGWSHIKGDYEGGMAEAEMPTKCQLGLVNVHGKEIPAESSIPGWWNSPGLLKSVMAFDQQPKRTRAEQLAQLRRNEAARKKPSSKP